MTTDRPDRAGGHDVSAGGDEGAAGAAEVGGSGSPTDGPQGTVTATPPVAQTRASAAWTAASAAAILLALLIVFVAQSTQRGQVNFLIWHGRSPTSVLLLIACVIGAALVVVAGIARILQLRHRTSPAVRRGTPDERGSGAA